MYSISYVPSGGDFGGQECAFWQSYGRPYLFDSYAAADSFIATIPWLRSLDGKVVSARIGALLSAEMVEVSNGRRKVVGFQRPVVNEQRPDYKKVMELITKCQPLCR